MPAVRRQVMRGVSSRASHMSALIVGWTSGTPRLGSTCDCLEERSVHLLKPTNFSMTRRPGMNKEHVWCTFVTLLWSVGMDLIRFECITEVRRYVFTYILEMQNILQKPGRCLDRRRTKSAGYGSNADRIFSKSPEFRTGLKRLVGWVAASHSGDSCTRLRPTYTTAQWKAER